MTADTAFRNILELWLAGGQPVVDRIMNALYRLAHPREIADARIEVARIVRNCERYRGGDEISRRRVLRDYMALCWQYTRDWPFDWKQDPDVLAARRYRHDCEDAAAWAALLGAALGYIPRTYSLWADTPDFQRHWWNRFMGHAATVLYLADGRAVLMTSNRTVYWLAPDTDESIADQVLRFAQKDTNVAYRFFYPDIAERLPATAASVRA